MSDDKEKFSFSEFWNDNKVVLIIVLVVLTLLILAQFLPNGGNYRRNKIIGNTFPLSKNFYKPNLN